MTEALHLVVRHRLEKAESERIGKHAVLLEALAIITALNIVEPARVAAVVAGVEPPQRINFDAESVAAAFSEDFECLLFRMVAPDMLANHLNGWIFEAGARDIGAHGAAVGAVKPAINSPAQAVRRRVAIFQPESLQQHDGIAGRMIGVVLGRIEEQIRWIQHEDAAAAPSTGGGDAQSVQKHRVLVVDAVAVGVLVNGDAILAPNMVWRRCWDLVIDHSPVLVPAQNFQPGRIRLL